VMTWNLFVIFAILVLIDVLNGDTTGKGRR
jgi:hypothetical protein